MAFYQPERSQDFSFISGTKMRSEIFLSISIIIIFHGIVFELVNKLFDYFRSSKIW